MADNKDKNQNPKDGNEDPNKKGDQSGDQGNQPGAGKGGEDNSIPYARFKEVNDELQALRDEKKKREDDELKSKGKTDELLKQREGELEKTRTEYQELKLTSAIEREAFKQGIKDTDAAAKLIDRSLITVDKDGNVSGVDGAVKKLLETRPYLAGSDSQGDTTKNIGTGTSPGKDEPKGKIWPYSEVRAKWADVPWTRNKHDEYDGKTGREVLEQAEKEGRIDYSK